MYLIHTQTFTRYLECMLYIDPPSPPQRVSAHFHTATTANISWTEPEVTYGPLSNYTVNCQLSNSGNHWRGGWSERSEICIALIGQEIHSHITHNTTLWAWVDSLRPYTQYTCCVSARNNGGTSAHNCTSFTTDESGIYHNYIAIWFNPPLYLYT